MRQADRAVAGLLCRVVLVPEAMQYDKTTLQKAVSPIMSRHLNNDQSFVL